MSTSRWRRWNAKMSGELTRSLFGRWARAATDSEQHQFSKFLNFTQQLSLNLISLFSTNAKKADFRFPQFVSLRSYEQLFSNIKCPIKMISLHDIQFWYVSMFLEVVFLIFCFPELSTVDQQSKRCFPCFQSLGSAAAKLHKLKGTRKVRPVLTRTSWKGFYPGF